MAYGNVARRLVSGLKFNGRNDLAPWMAQWMAVRGHECFDGADLVVPVPLHWHRRLSRKYNQSAELARRVAILSGSRYLPQALSRIRRTRAQVGLSAGERAENVQGAFQVPAAMQPEIQGRTVVLVDDVYTSGATARACATALARAGVKSVRVLTFATVVDQSI